MQKTEHINELMFTIVIPVYNTSAYLNKCVTSVLDQTYGNLEIVLVNDGSTDASKELCQELANNNSRISVIHQENQGLSAARNTGIQAAKGDYIIFLDSDDYIDNDACEDLCRSIGQSACDVVTTKMKIVNNGYIKYPYYNHNKPYEIMSGKAYMIQELFNKTMSMAAVQYVYNRTFLQVHNLKFRVGIYHEDEEFTPRALALADKVLRSDLCFYNYLIRSGSITTNKYLYKNVKDLYATLRSLESIFSKEEEPLRSLFMESLLEKYLYMYAKAGVNQPEYSQIRDKEFVIGKAKSWKNKAKVCLFLLDDSLYCHLSRRNSW